MSKEKSIGLVILSVAMILALIGGIGFYFKKTNEKVSNNNYKEFNYEELKYQLEACKYGDLYDNKIFADTDGCDELGKIINIPVKSENAKVLDGIENFVLYEDEGLKIYNIENKKYMKVSLEDEYSKYKLNLNSNKDDVVGIIYSNEMKSLPTINDVYGYYNIRKNKKLYDNKYNMLEILNGTFIVGTEFLEVENPYPYNGSQKRYILSTDDEKEFLNEAAESLNEYFTFKDGFIFYEEAMVGTKKVYTNDLKLIIKDVKDCVIGSNKTLYNLENNEIKVYNSKGDVIETHPVSGDVKVLVSDYYIVSENGLYYIRDYSGYELKLNSLNKDIEFSVTGNYLEDTKEYIFTFYMSKPIDGYDVIQYTFNAETKDLKSKFLTPDEHI